MPKAVQYYLQIALSLVVFALAPNLSTADQTRDEPFKQSSSTEHDSTFTKNRYFDFPQQSLIETLVSFCDFLDINLVLNAKLAEAHQSRPVKGNFSAEFALKKILHDLPLVHEYDKNTQTLTIIEIPSKPEQIDVTDHIPTHNGLEEIVVQGMRGSLLTATKLKKQSQGIVDAIVATDIKKFPDTNLAEAVQRIPGVSIDRSYNNEGSKITVRGFGPEFNLVTLNNRQLPSAGISAVSSELNAEASRSFDFAHFASENIALVEVHKTSKAYLASGGIGSVVNLRTLKPLDQPSQTLSVGVKAGHDTSVSGTVNPEISALFTTKSTDEKIGFLINGSYQNRESFTQEAQIFDWYHRPAEYYPEIANEGSFDYIWFPEGQAFYLTNAEQLRTNIHTVLQFEPSRDWLISLDHTAVRFNSKATSNNNYFFFNNDFIAENSWQIDSQGNTLFMEQLKSEFDKDFAYNISSSMHGFKNRLNSSGLNIQFSPSNKLTLSFDTYRAKSTSVPYNHEGFLEIGFSIHQVGYKTFDARKDIPAIGFTFEESIDEQDLSPYFDIYEGYTLFKRSENIVDGTKLELDWEPNESLKLITGFSQIKSEVYADYYSTDFIDTYYDIPGEAEIFDDSLFTRSSTNTLFDEFSGALENIPYYYSLDLPSLLSNYDFYSDYFLDSFDVSWDSEFDTWFEQGEEHYITEDVTAFYGQITYIKNYKAFSAELSAGLRVEDTSTQIQSYSLVPVDIAWIEPSLTETLYIEDLIESSALHDYSNSLPNLDLKITAFDNWVFRASASKSLTRSDLMLMRPITEVDYKPPVAVYRAAQGNTKLKPFLSNNLDLSVEWYYQDSSFISLNYFSKEVDNFIISDTYKSDLYGLTDPSTSREANEARDELRHAGIENPSDKEVFDYLGLDASDEYIGDSGNALIQWEIKQPINGERTNVTGWEISAQHIFGQTGWGLGLNYTDVKTDSPFNIDDTEFQFSIPGVSDSFNFIGFYEKGRLQCRIALNWRDEFLSSLDRANFFAIDYSEPRTQPQFTKAYSQWDFNFGYIYSDQVTIYVEGINITSENQEIYYRYPSQFSIARQFGSVFNIGVDYKL